MEDHKSKLSDIEDICKLWSGLYIGGDSAMSKIINILNTNYKIVQNVTFSDNKGNEIFSVDEAMIKFSKK